jgi:Uma2 family endonuclease
MTTAATQAKKLITAEELYSTVTELNCELVKGEIIEMPSPGYMHGKCVSRFARLLSNHVNDNHLGDVLTNDTGFLLKRNPDTVRGPDVAFVQNERLPAGELDGHFPGAPDLAVEVLSPSEGAFLIDDKISEYLEAGCRLVVVLNPKRRTATLYQANRQPYVLRGDEPLNLSEVVHGFHCNLADVFG